MTNRFGRKIGAFALAGLWLASPAWGAAVRLDELEAQLAELGQQLAKLAEGPPAGSSDVAQRVEQLEEDVEQAALGRRRRDGGGVEGPPGVRTGRIEGDGAKQGLVLGGYSEGPCRFERFADQRQDGAPSGRLDQLDMLRQVIYVGYKFDEHVLFNSEVEFEHGSTGKGGEVSVEMAYVDYRPSQGLGVRAGLVLMPMGWTNEQHEPPSSEAPSAPRSRARSSRRPGVSLGSGCSARLAR